MKTGHAISINLRDRGASQMSQEKAHDLARLCTDVVRKGEVFRPFGKCCLKVSRLLMVLRSEGW
jgi:hypothetical protein